MTERHTPTRRPACYSTDWPLPARAPKFWDAGRSCGNAGSVALWLVALEHTPTCRGCRRGLRGLLLAAGDNPAKQREAFALAGVPPFRYDLSIEVDQ